jgi:hypothetical protein
MIVGFSRRFPGYSYIFLELSVVFDLKGFTMVILAQHDGIFGSYDAGRFNLVVEISIIFKVLLLTRLLLLLLKYIMVVWLPEGFS